MEKNKVSPEDKAIVAVDPNKIPEELPIIPLSDLVAFPTLNMSFAVPLKFMPLLEEVMKGNRLIGAVGSKLPADEIQLPGELCETGTVVRILHASRTTENTVLVIVNGLERFRVVHWIPGENRLKAAIELAPETIESDLETKALHRSVSDLTREIFAFNSDVPKEAIDGLARIKDSLHLAYIAAAHSQLDFEARQMLLEEDSLKGKLRTLIKNLTHEKEILSLGNKIKSDAKDEMNKTQRDFYLRQQLRAIKKELGETDDNETEQDDYRQRIAEAGMTEEARKQALKELDRFEEMSPQSAEYSMVKGYLDWLVDLPWKSSTEDQTDIISARQILDRDHYGLREVKERVVEYLAVRNLLAIRDFNKTRESGTDSAAASGAILCFAGPPGVGKTSLGHSIARAMGRQFTRMSLGGVRDETEIRGHRRTYVGAMPGRIIQAVKRAGTRNPVFMLDEVDKISRDWRGDPSSALLEVLDPAQNSAFRDHYLDVDFDLSDVIFIATANQLETIPAPLRDRMEIIQIDGYTELEKVQIARRHLIPRQLTGHGLSDSDVTFMDGSIHKMIRDYTREAGVRQLERLIGAICRKLIVKLTAGKWEHVLVTPGQVADFLRKEKFESELSEIIDVPGISTGLAVTSVGGDILFIEATRMDGNGQLTVTGHLGDVMKESAKIAQSYVRSKATYLEIDPAAFKAADIHLHVPAGATPKDGPSAGIAMVMALASLFSGRLVRSSVGMTGEVTLRGRVLPVGGIKMKILAAHRAGLKAIILPRRNAKDLEEVPKEVRESMEFVFVDRIDEAIEAGLSPFANSQVSAGSGVAHLGDQTDAGYLTITARSRYIA